MNIQFANFPQLLSSLLKHFIAQAPLIDRFKNKCKVSNIVQNKITV